jgi:hypothetical protein
MLGEAMTKVGAAVRQISALAFVTFSLGLLGAASASGQQPTQAQKNAVRSACRSDYMAHCASVPTGGKASLECLQQNMASLSTACQSAVNAIAGGGAAAPAAEQPPAATPAAPAPAAAAPTELAPPPAEANAPPPQREFPPMSPRQEMVILRWSCGPDFRALCGDVPPGGGRVVACLRDNAPSLSPRCRRALMGAGRR